MLSIPIPSLLDFVFQLEPGSLSTHLLLDDPSEIYRPKLPEFELDKDVENFRNYDNLDDDMLIVRDTYYEMHKKQTHEFASSQVGALLFGEINTFH